MLKTLMVTTAISGLLVGAATAQSTPSTSAPSATPPAASAPAGNTQFINSQGTEQWLSSNFLGTDVIGPDDAKIGDVNDVLFERNGQVVAYVVGVGGFLGIGAKNVALAPTSFQVVAGQNASDTKLKLNMTKDQLQQAASFETMRDKEQAARKATTTTGSGSSSGMAPRPAPAPAPTAK
jgi:hypothetical protein